MVQLNCPSTGSSYVCSAEGVGVSENGDLLLELA